MTHSLRCATCGWQREFEPGGRITLESPTTCPACGQSDPLWGLQYVTTTRLLTLKKAMA